MSQGGTPREPIPVHRVIARLNVGGPAIHVVELTRGLEEHGFRTRLVAGRVEEDEGDMSYYALERGVEVHSLPALSRRIAPLRDAAALLRLFLLFVRERPRVVHTHTAKAGALGRAAAFAARVPLRVHTYHGHVLGGSYFPGAANRLFLAVERALARITHRIVVLTEAQKAEMAGGLGIGTEERYRVVPLGLDLDPFVRGADEADREAVRRSLHLEPDAVIVGMVGRLVPVKNHEVVFHALRSLERLLATPDGRRPVRLLVVGGGSREEELRALAEALGVEDRIRWLGWRRDLPDLYRAMDVLALPSHDEGTPVAVIEALAAGVPVAARAVGGVPEVLEGGRLGTLLEEEDPAAWAHRLARVLDDPPGPEAREEARRSVLRRFHRERLFRDMAELYREGLGGAASG